MSSSRILQRGLGGPTSRGALAGVVTASSDAEAAPDKKDKQEDQDPLVALLAASATGLLSGALIVSLNYVVHFGRDFFDKLPAPLSHFGPTISAVMVAILALAKPLQGQGADLQSLKAADGWPSLDRAAAPARGAAAALTLAGGNSLGPEGPGVEIGANVGATLGASLLSGSSGSSRSSAGETQKQFQWNLLAAGCASGIAAGFNAPVAGLFFSLEALGTRSPPAQAKQGSAAADDESFKALGPSMQLLAAVLAATVSQLGLGSAPAVDLDRVVWAPRQSLWELPVFLILGAACGLSAAGLASASGWVRGRVADLQAGGAPAWIFPPVAGLLVSGATFVGVSEVVYRGFENVNYVLQEVDGLVPTPSQHKPLYHLFELFVAKVFLTAVCQASGLVGGLFAPALFMGVSLGGIFGRGLRDYAWSWPLMLGDIHAFSVPATYSIVGMAATLAAVCRVPLTAVVLIIELTGGSNYGVVLPTVAAVGMAVYVENRVSAWLRDRSGSDSGTHVEAGQGPALPSQAFSNGALAKGASAQPRVVRVDPTSSVADLLRHLRGSEQGVGDANAAPAPVAVVVEPGGGERDERAVTLLSGATSPTPALAADVSGLEVMTVVATSAHGATNGSASAADGTNETPAVRGGRRQ